MKVSIKTAMTVRSMTPNDVDDVLEIDRLSFPTAWTKESYLRDLVNPSCYYLAAETEGKVVAYAGMWVVLDESHITTLAVHPDYQRKGLGRMLLENMIRFALARQAKTMTLEVRMSNRAAQRLYGASAFVPTAHIKNYYMDTGEDAVVMRLEVGKWPGPRKGNVNSKV
jgi:ribosomal-protein-alanine N-acetyltransferase